MTCSELEDRMIDLIDGRLGRADEVRLHAHMEECAACRERLQTWRTMVPLVRGMEPVPPAPMRIRRMEMAIERELFSAAGGSPRRHSSWWWAVPAALAAAAVAVAGLWFGAPRPPALRATGAVLVELSGPASHDGNPVARGASLPIRSKLTLAAVSRASVRMGRVASFSLTGATVRILAGAPQIAVGLEDGTLEANVSPRGAGEEFAVVVPDGRVVVRGTRFTVMVRAGASTLSVSQGLVVAISNDGREHLVSPGETFSFAGFATTAAEGPGTGAPAPGTSPPAAPAPGSDCSGVRRSCEDVTRRARDSMRSGHPADAAAALGTFTVRAAGCGQHLGACAAEVGYLRAEALRMDGDLDGAVAAYRGLDRASAPAAMRQNALIASGNVERRRGALRPALRDYERAVAVFPRGPLSEQAMAAAMDVASGIDAATSAAAARRYLEAYPSGAAAPRARHMLEAAGTR